MGLIQMDRIEDYQTAHHLLEEAKAILRYSPSLYENYYAECYQKFVEKSHLYNGDNFIFMPEMEVGEHGILGACVLYTKLMNSIPTPAPKVPKTGYLYEITKALIEPEPPSLAAIMKKDDWTSLSKSVCECVLDHNIWKDLTNVENSTWKSEIDKDHYKKIGLENPLLLLLVIADTLEYVKRFCSSNPEGRIIPNPKDLMGEIELSVSKKRIQINYQKLGGESKEQLEKWLNGIQQLDEWTTVKSSINRKRKTITLLRKKL